MLALITNSHHISTGKCPMIPNDSCSHSWQGAVSTEHHLQQAIESRVFVATRRANLLHPERHAARDICAGPKAGQPAARDGASGTRTDEEADETQLTLCLSTDDFILTLNNYFSSHTNPFSSIPTIYLNEGLIETAISANISPLSARCSVRLLQLDLSSNFTIAEDFGKNQGQKHKDNRCQLEYSSNIVN